MERSTKVNISTVNHCIEDTFKIIRKFRIPYKLFFNIDETRLAFNEVNKSSKAIVPSVNHIHHYIIPDHAQAATYVPIIMMNSIYLQFLVVPGLEKVEEMTAKEIKNEEEKSNSQLFVIKTVTGWVNKKAFEIIMLKFVKKLKEDGINERVLLFLDKLKMHMSDEVVLLSSKNNIITAYIPEHTTHFYQPLDNRFFKR